MGDFTDSANPPPPPPPRQVPFREDCWTEEATSTLVDAWGRRYLDLNRGNLRQKDWQEVADIVNSRHGHTKKTRRTDVQCKNRIDTLKKKYKVEKARILDSGGTLTSSWRFYPQLDLLIGSNSNSSKGSKLTPSSFPSSVAAAASSQYASPLSLPLPPMAVPISYRRPVSSSMVTPAILPMKRPMPMQSLDEPHYKKNYLTIAAAEDDDDDDEDDDEEDDEETEGEEVKVGKDRRATAAAAAAAADQEGGEGIRRLAKAIERFGEIFEKVEGIKYRQMVELEKQRMQFAKDLEVQRMQYFMDTQVELEKIKRAKRSQSSDD